MEKATQYCDSGTAQISPSAQCSGVPTYTIRACSTIVGNTGGSLKPSNKPLSGHVLEWKQVIGIALLGSLLGVLCGLL